MAPDLPPDPPPPDDDLVGEVGTWAWDIAADRVTADRHLARLFGVSEADAAGGPLSAYLAAIHPDDRPATEARLRRASETGRPYESACRVRDAAGLTHDLVARGRAEPGPDGTPVRLAGVVVDVTRRRRTEAALRASEARLRVALAAGRMGTWDLDLATGTMTCCAICKANYGRRPDDPFTYDDVAASVHPDDQERWQRAATAAIQSGGDLDVEYRVFWPDGTEHWVHVRGHSPAREAGRAAVMSGVSVDVTARKRAEDELFASRETLRAVLDNIPQRVFWKAPDLTYLGCNRPFARDMGFDSPEQVVGKDDHQGSWAAVAEQFRADDRRVIETGEPKLDYEEPQTAADGTRFWIRTSKQPLRGPDGRVVGVLGTYEDVTDRKRAEQALRETEARFRTLVESLPDAVLINADGRIAFCNPACVRLLGAGDPARLLGRPALGIVAPDSVAAVRRRVAAISATGRAQPEEEIALRRTDGSTVPVLVSSLPITDGGALAILVVFHDLTERRRVERQLRQQEALLREAAELAHVGGWGFDPATGRSEWTDETFRIHNLDPSAGAEPADTGLARFPGDDGPRIRAAVRAAVERGTPYDLELDFAAADGQRKRVRAICRPVVEGGKVVWVRGSLQDVTARHSLEAQFRQSQKMEAFGQLAGGVAHDFNNLLTVINGYCDLLLDQTPPGDRSRRLLTEVRKAGERSAALTRQLLAFSRKQVVAPRVLDPNAVVGDLASLLRKLIGEDVRLQTALAPDAWPVLADPGQMEQVLMNLCVNARDAMPTGGRLRIETGNAEVSPAEAAAHPGAKAGPHAVLSVTDTGTGMPPEVVARVFEPFFTTKGLGRGTGLGLATVHGIVTQAGGHVRVTSRVGAGTTFAVYLPRAGDAAVAEEAETRSGIRKAARGKETVLVVEDEDGVRAFVRAVLTGCGYQVLEAANGEHAAAVAEAHPGRIHLLMTDVVMPGAGGRAAAERVAASHPEAKVLFVSGYTDDAVLRHGVAAEAVHFLQKPFSPAALAAKVRQVLDG